MPGSPQGEPEALFGKQQCTDGEGSEPPHSQGLLTPKEDYNNEQCIMYTSNNSSSSKSSHEISMDKSHW